MFKRILMTAADSSPGGGSAPASSAPAGTGTPPAPAAAPAPANGGAPTIDRATEEALIKKGRDAAFAELRRNGALKKSFLNQQSTTEQQPPAQPRGEAVELRRLDRALSRSGLGVNLKSDRAHERLERAFADEAPEDVDGWLKDYFADFGTASATAAAPPPATTTASNPPASTAANPQQRPSSDRGAPAPSATPPEEVNLLTLSQQERDNLIKSKGVRWYSAQLRKQMTGVKVKFRG